jgi:hypothetical protein
VVQAQQENLLTNVYIEAFRKLAPDMGAYQNEVGLECYQYRINDVDFDNAGGPIRAKLSTSLLG